MFTLFNQMHLLSNNFVINCIQKIQHKFQCVNKQQITTTHLFQAQNVLKAWSVSRSVSSGGETPHICQWYNLCMKWKVGYFNPLATKPEIEVLSCTTITSEIQWADNNIGHTIFNDPSDKWESGDFTQDTFINDINQLSLWHTFVHCEMHKKYGYFQTVCVQDGLS